VLVSVNDPAVVDRAAGKLRQNKRVEGYHQPVTASELASKNEANRDELGGFTSAF
jgi:hypothetical protein